jgi:hypothetical protein
VSGPLDGLRESDDSIARRFPVVDPFDCHANDRGFAVVFPLWKPGAIRWAPNVQSVQDRGESWAEPATTTKLLVLMIDNPTCGRTASCVTLRELW